jgi:hypothetical protein
MASVASTPGYDGKPSMRESIGEMVDVREQVASGGRDGTIHVRHPVALAKCKVCGETYLNEAYLRAHKCPGNDDTNGGTNAG